MTEAGRSTDNNDCRVCCVSEKAEGANSMISKETRKKARKGRGTGWPDDTGGKGSTAEVRSTGFKTPGDSGVQLVE